MRVRLIVAVAAVVLAAVVAMPALGGPSLARQIANLTAREKKLEKRVDALARTPVIAGATGPAGAPGPAGPKGDAGPRGAPGAAAPLDARLGRAATGAIGTTLAPVVQTTLGRAGDYLVEGNLVVTNAGAAAVTVTCSLVSLPADALIDTATVRLGAAGGINTETLSLGGGLSATATGSARIDCAATGASVTFTDADLVALG